MLFKPELVLVPSKSQTFIKALEPVKKKGSSKTINWWTLYIQYLITKKISTIILFFFAYFYFTKILPKMIHSLLLTFPLPFKIWFFHNWEAIIQDLFRRKRGKRGEKIITACNWYIWLCFVLELKYIWLLNFPT